MIRKRISLIPFTSVVLLYSAAWADSIGLVSRNSPEVACCSTSFHGYVGNYKNGKFGVFRVMYECTGEKGIPKECDQFRRVPREGVPPHVIKAVPNPGSHVYLYHEFSDDAVNVITFDEVYGDPCPKIDIRPEQRKNVPPPVFSWYQPSVQPIDPPLKIKNPSYTMQVRAGGVEGEPLPGYAIKIKAASPKIIEGGITVGDVIPIVGPGDKVDPQLAGKYVFMEVPGRGGREFGYDTYLVEGLVGVDRAGQQGSLTVKRIWLAYEKVVTSVRSGEVTPSQGAIVEVEERGDIENLGWNLVIRGTNRFLPADVRGLRLQNDRRILRIRVKSEAKGQLGRSPEVIQLIRR